MVETLQSSSTYSSSSTMTSQIELHNDNTDDSSKFHQLKATIPQTATATGPSHDVVKSLSYRRCAVDIKFEDIGYSVKVNGTQKTVLSGISGQFKHGRINCIMGPSGAGKSSLLNVLAGFNTIVNGTVYINNVPYEAKKCLSTMSRISSYILQDDFLLGELTSRETVVYAARFKIPQSVVASSSQRATKAFEAIADEVLSLTGLSETANRRVSRLSGGQRKRLAVAVELVNYPPVIYLDECTTGLDSTSCYRLVKMLKMLAKCGCNIIATIHQPNSLVYRMFDWLYVMAPGGHLAYNGHPMAVATALDMVGIPVNKNENVADVLFEKGHIPTLSEAWGSLKRKADFKVAPSEEPQKHHGASHESNPKSHHSSAVIEGDYYIWVFDGYEHSHRNQYEHNKSTALLPRHKGADLVNFCTAQSISSFAQVNILLSRSILQAVRDKVFALACLVYVLAALLCGNAFINMAQDDEKVAFNPKVIFFFTNVIIIAASVLSVMNSDRNVQMLVRDNVNRWYSVGVYNLVRITVDALINIVTSTLFTVLVWTMSQQPLLYISLPIAVCVLCLQAMAIHHTVFIMCLYGETQANFNLPFILLIAHVLGGGGNLPVDQLPDWIQWFGYINYSSYSFFGLMKAAYSPYDGANVIQCKSGYFLCSQYPNGTAVLHDNHLSYGSPWIEWAKIVACHFCLFLLGWPLLAHKVRSCKREIARI